MPEILRFHGWSGDFAVNTSVLQTLQDERRFEGGLHCYVRNSLANVSILWHLFRLRRRTTVLRGFVASV